MLCGALLGDTWVCFIIITNSGGKFAADLPCEGLFLSWLCSSWADVTEQGPHLVAAEACRRVCALYMSLPPMEFASYGVEATN